MNDIVEFKYPFTDEDGEVIEVILSVQEDPFTFEVLDENGEELPPEIKAQIEEYDLLEMERFIVAQLDLMDADRIADAFDYETFRGEDKFFFLE